MARTPPSVSSAHQPRAINNLWSRFLFHATCIKAKVLDFLKLQCTAFVKVSQPLGDEGVSQTDQLLRHTNTTLTQSSQLVSSANKHTLGPFYKKKCDKIGSKITREPALIRLFAIDGRACSGLNNSNDWRLATSRNSLWLSSTSADDRLFY